MTKPEDSGEKPALNFFFFKIIILRISHNLWGQIHDFGMSGFGHTARIVQL